MKKNTIWIVEMFNPELQRWEATVGAALSRMDARFKCRAWSKRNTADRFRVQKYESTAKELK